MAPDGIAADADRLIGELELQAANLGQSAKPATPQSGAVVRKG